MAGNELILKRSYHLESWSIFQPAMFVKRSVSPIAAGFFPNPQNCKSNPSVDALIVAQWKNC